MIRFILGLVLGLSVASAGADIAIQQPNGSFAVLSTVVAAGIHTLVIKCQ